LDIPAFGQKPVLMANVMFALQTIPAKTVVKHKITVGTPARAAIKQLKPATKPPASATQLLLVHQVIRVAKELKHVPVNQMVAGTVPTAHPANAVMELVQTAPRNQPAQLPVVQQTAELLEPSVIMEELAI
jgi:hypothetical protein